MVRGILLLTMVLGAAVFLLACENDSNDDLAEEENEIRLAVAEFVEAISSGDPDAMLAQTSTKLMERCGLDSAKRLMTNIIARFRIDGGPVDISLQKIVVVSVLDETHANVQIQLMSMSQSVDGTSRFVKESGQWLTNFTEACA
jgi:hypothetical protein